MNSKWKEYTLSDLGAIKTGKTPPARINNAFGGNVPFITPRDMDGRKWMDSTERFLSEEGLNAVKTSLIPKRSVAVSCIGSDMGKAVLISRPSVTNQQINTITVDENKFNAEFIYYDLSTRQEELKTIASGSATPILNKGHFSNVKISIPDKPIQNTIAKILGDLDDKIALNTRINQTLEAMAQALFKSWFVDFDPVKAKMETRANGGSDNAVRRAAMAVISNKSEEELDQFEQTNPSAFAQLAATADLFPESLVESELGLIPEGWDVKTISDITKFSSERVAVDSLSLDTYISTENMVANKGGITKASSLSTTNTVPEFKNGHILVSNIRPYFQKIWLATFSGGRSNDVLGFVPMENGTSEFVYHLMYQDSFFTFMMATSKGAKMPRGDKGAIMGYKLAYDNDTALHFSEKVKEFNDISAEHVLENKSLAQTRDTLLPKLLSGEIDLSSFGDRGDVE